MPFCLRVHLKTRLRAKKNTKTERYEDTKNEAFYIFAGDPLLRYAAFGMTPLIIGIRSCFKSPRITRIYTNCFYLIIKQIKK